MNTSIKRIQTWFERHPKTKQWAWFVGLWCAGLAAVTIFTYPIKLLMKCI